MVNHLRWLSAAIFLTWTAAAVGSESQEPSKWIEPTFEIDLSGEWNFVPENGVQSAIRVPGGGWLKQGFTCESGVYERWITIPKEAEGRVVRLELGAVNHELEGWIGEDVASLASFYRETTAFTGQDLDLTPHVQAGKRYLIRLAVRAFRDGRPVAPHAANWCESIARGIFRSAHLRVFPAIRIADLQVRTSVRRAELLAIATLVNSTPSQQRVMLHADVSSWNKAGWDYPVTTPVPVVLGPGETREVELGAMKWKAGPRSYWWPNVPYQPGYRAQLHLLDARLETDKGALHRARVRFGFREIRQDGPFYRLNEVRVNFRGDSLQVANYDRIDHGGKGDAIDTLPGFLPPSESNPGWPAAVDNFLRLNYNVQRQHMGPWTPYMLDVCDELGLMLIGESASRLNGFDRVNGRAPHEVKCLQDIVKRDRHHPSLVRWSTVNEAQTDDPHYHLELYEAVKALDPTRPISEDVWTKPGHYLNRSVEEVYSLLLDKDDFSWFEHYLSHDEKGNVRHYWGRMNDALIPMADRPYGVGEGNWYANGRLDAFTAFAAQFVLNRIDGASDIRPYVLLSLWVSSIPGVKTQDMIIEGNRFRPLLGDDNCPDPWSHPGLMRIQTATSPFLVADRDFWWRNRSGNGTLAFPTHLPELPADTEVERELSVFNDSLERAELEILCTLTSGHAQNPVLSVSKVNLVLEPGTKQTIRANFVTPPVNDPLVLRIRVIRGGATVFDDASTTYAVVGKLDREWDYDRSLDRSFSSLRLRVD
ncbi:MAG: glycoside hydrolase family 2 TIM barrel-domain containing protein [Opitutaceae bacterium]|nr:glycoside hydrolase family 2 TIM barrel-domain containing protein [Opitutaceae bacterium]